MYKITPHPTINSSCSLIVYYQYPYIVQKSFVEVSSPIIFALTELYFPHLFLHVIGTSFKSFSTEVSRWGIPLICNALQVRHQSSNNITLKLMAWRECISGAVLLEWGWRCNMTSLGSKNTLKGSHSQRIAENKQCNWWVSGSAWSCLFQWLEWILAVHKLWTIMAILCWMLKITQWLF